MTRDALLLIAALSFAPRTGGAQLNGPLTIALRPYAGTALRTVDVVVGQHTRPFLFDTGAGFTVLTPDAVADAGCTPFGEVVGFRADGQRLNMQRCGPVPLRLGGYETTEEIGVFDLNALLGKDAPPVGGLVGLSSFGGRAITLDLAHDRVTVETPRSLADRVAGMH
ncbi:MAG: aspartyl protease family protein, partial [Gemmatimonadaceae bacterium]